MESMFIILDMAPCDLEKVCLLLVTFIWLIHHLLTGLHFLMQRQVSVKNIFISGWCGASGQCQ